MTDSKRENEWECKMEWEWVQRMSQKFFVQKKNERANNLAVDEDKCRDKKKHTQKTKNKNKNSKRTRTRKRKKRNERKMKKATAKWQLVNGIGNLCI